MCVKKALGVAEIAKKKVKSAPKCLRDSETEHKTGLLH